MSENIIHTVGHHTFRYDPPEFTEAGAPCMSKMTTRKVHGKNIKSYPFLGDGYYFWDYNLIRAQDWGKSHYSGKFKIMELPMILEGNRFLDLVGSRKDL